MKGSKADVRSRRPPPPGCGLRLLKKALPETVSPLRANFLISAIRDINPWTGLIIVLEYDIASCRDICA